MFKIILPILVVVLSVLFGKHLMDTAPEAKKKPFVQRVPIVEVQELKPQQYTVKIKATGLVKAGTKTNLVAEVSGRIISLSDQFQEGSYFNKGQQLLSIDPSNYNNALDIAKSEVVANQANLKQIKDEQSSNERSIKLAKRNLVLGEKEVQRVRSLLQKKLLPRSAVDAEEQKVNQLQQRLQELEGIQSTFTSRKNATEARINTTLARLKQEELNLSRTKIKSPYAGRVLKKNVDVGQFVTTGTTLGEIIATDFVNVELPLSLKQYELLGLPESFRNTSFNQDDFPSAILNDPNSLSDDSWSGKVVRSGAALSAESRQINVIVRVDKPYDKGEKNTKPIRIGQYLQATLTGKSFDNVYVLPPVAVLYNREIRLLKDGKISVKAVQVLWNTQNEVVVRTDEDLDGELLILTKLNQAVDGTEAITAEQHKKRTKRLKEQAKTEKENAERLEKERVSNARKSLKKETQHYNRSEQTETQTN